MSSVGIADTSQQPGSTLLEGFLEEVVRLLSAADGPGESQTIHSLRCPNPNCSGQDFRLAKANGTGLCPDEDRQYSPWESAELLGLDGYRLLGMFTGPPPVNPVTATLATSQDSLRDFLGGQH